GERVFHMILRSAETNYSDALAVDDSPPVEIVDGPLVGRHLARSFFQTSVMFHVTAGFRSMSYLEHHDSPRRQGLRGKAAVPRSVDPELVFREPVCLQDERIPDTRTVVRREVETSLD